MEKRTIQVGVRLTDKELEKLDKQVKKSGLSRSSYLRDAQIARVANSTGYIMADEYKAAMAELMPLLDEIVAEAEKPMPPKPLEPPANPRVWRPRKPQVSKRKPRDTLSHGTVPESDLQSSTKDTIR